MHKSSIQQLRQHNSCADLFQLSGIIAVRVAGGPFINFTPGGLLILPRSAPLLNAGSYLYVHGWHTLSTGRRDSRVAPPQGRLPSFDLGNDQPLLPALIVVTAAVSTFPCTHHEYRQPKRCDTAQEGV